MPTAAGNTNNVPELANILKPNTNYQSVFSSGQFTGFLGLLDKLKAPNPVINNKAALTIAAGDQVTESIFRLLGNPSEAAKFAGRRVFFGVCTVSVNPGYRTKKGYAADLGILTRFEFREARIEVVERLVQDKNHIPAIARAALVVDYGLNSTRSLKELCCEDLAQMVGDFQKKSGGERIKALKAGIPTNLLNTGASAPLAMAVSPLADVTVLDEASSLRNQTDFGLSLAGVLRQAGLQAQASAVEQYARRRESDARTRTALASVTAYSAGGGLFGWTVGPRFRAVGNPGAKNKGAPADLLDQQTFPSLVVVGFNQDDLYPRLGLSDDGRIEVLEPYVAFTSFPRWLPLKNGWWQKRFSEADRLEASARLANASGQLAELADMVCGTFAKTAGLADFRIRALKFQTFGNDNGQNFAPELIVPLSADCKPKLLDIPSITAVVPAEVELESDPSGKPQPRPQRFAIVGKNLKAVDTAKISALSGQVGGISASFDNNAILLSATVKDKEPIVFNFPWSLTDPSGKALVLWLSGPKISVSVRKLPEKPKDEGAPIAILKATQTQAAQGAASEFSVSISPKASADDLKTAKSIIEDEINRGKLSVPDTNLTIQVNIEKKK